MHRATLQKLLQPNYVIAATGIVAAAAVAVAFLVVNQRPSPSYVSPTVGALAEEVDATGQVAPAESVDLSFDTTGTIAAAYAEVGERVRAGQTLATLRGADLSAQVEQAEAALAMQQAKLAGLEAGATPQAVAAAQTAITNAENSLAQAASDAYVKSDDAIRNKVDQFIQNARTASPTLALQLSDSQAAQNILNGRGTIEGLLNSWQQLRSSSAQGQDVSALAQKASGYLAQVSSYLDTVAAGLTTAIPSMGYPLSTIQTYQSNIATARANVSTDVAALTAAQSSLASAQASLNVTTASASASDLAAQQAAVASAKANVDVAKANLAKTVVSAPISGTITVDNAHVGATVVPGASVISMQSDAQFQIEAYVSETDQAKLKVGDMAQVGFDAYPDRAPLSAHVVVIDPAAAVQNGVAAYKVTLQFDTEDPSIKSGLTANAKIATAQAGNALSVPTSAIITQGDQKFVMKQTGNSDTLTAVTVGISSANGYTQITSGLAASDRIRAFGSQ